MKTSLNMFAVLSVLFLLGTAPLFAEEEVEVDYVALASTLAADGHYDRAEVALQSVDLNAEGVDLKTYYLVAGLISLNRSDWARAIDRFEELLAIGTPDSPWVYGYYAQALHGDGRWVAALKNVVKVGSVGAREPGLWLLKIDCEKKLGKKNAAWKSIADAEKHHPKDIRFPRLRTMYLLELGLFSAAADSAKKLVDRKDAQPEDALALAEGFRQGGAIDRAIGFLEGARVRFNDPRFDALLGYCYASKENYTAAGELLGRAAAVDNKYAVEAAEMFRKAGSVNRAMYHNSLIVDQKVKLRQRVAILVEESRYEEIAALYARLKRAKVLDDDAVRYAVAYAQFQIGDFDASVTSLKGVKDSAYFDSATRLRELISRCQNSDDGC